MSTFEVSVDATYLLTTDEVWPDGDAPENPTAEDVAQVMRSYGSKHRTLVDWGLDDPAVTVNGVVVWP